MEGAPVKYTVLVLLLAACKKPLTDADCKKTDGCRILGECTAKNGGCAPGSDIDCMSQSLWVSLEQCSYDPKSGNCINRTADAPTPAP